MDQYIKTAAVIAASALAASCVIFAKDKGVDLTTKVQLQRQAVLDSRYAPAGILEPALSGQASASFPRSAMAFVELEEGYTVSALEEAGMTVCSKRGNIAVVSLPIDSVASFSSLPCVRKLSLERMMKPRMDLSRQETGIDALRNGEVLDVPYSGKGVLTMIVDQGLDPNHPAFLDEAGVSRVKFLSYYDGTTDSRGIPNAEWYGENIVESIDSKGNPVYYPGTDKFSTDDATMYHGTHTMNAMAGGDLGNQYYGAATSSEIAASCGALSDACIAMGINGLVGYSQYRDETSEAGMPSVLNLSIGSTAGPHDPNGMMNRFLEECGKETIIVIAAGNEGDLKLALRKEMTEADNSLATLIYPYGFRYDASLPEDAPTNTYARNGYVTIYSDSDTPFTVNAVVLAGADGDYRKRASFNISSSDGDYYCSDASYASFVGGAVNNTVSRYFDGYLGGGMMYDESLGRFYGVFDYFLITKPSTGINPDGSEGVIVGFEVTGSDGQTIECYCDGMNTTLSDYNLEGYEDGMRDGTISDMAVGHNVLVVGAYTERDSWTNLLGEETGYKEGEGMEKGDIGIYSSFGTLSDGRTLPHVCAPGTAVISAVSRPYMDAVFGADNPAIAEEFQAVSETGGQKCYWKQETGTSMSTPIVSGAIALWLEADPSLTIDDVIDIISTTSRRDEFVEKGNPAQWGYGKFDAVAGLKEVIKRRTDGIRGVAVDGENDRLIISQAPGNVFEVFIGEAVRLDVKVFGADGRCVYATAFDGFSAMIDLGRLPHGLYVINVNGHSKKIML